MFYPSGPELTLNPVFRTGSCSDDWLATIGDDLKQLRRHPTGRAGPENRAPPKGGTFHNF